MTLSFKITAATAAAFAAIAASSVSIANSVTPHARAAAPTPFPAAKFTGHRLKGRKGEVKSGTVVPASALGTRYFLTANRGFSLAEFKEGTYPAATLDGGKTWKVSGPVLHVNAADAPEVVTEAGVTGRKTYFAYGGPQGGQVVDVTTNGGRRWIQTSFPEVVLAIVPAFHRLIAVLQESASSTSTTAITWVYVSKDGGKTWHYDSKLGAM